MGAADGSTGLANRTPITAVPEEIREKRFMRLRRTAEPIKAFEGTTPAIAEASAAEAVVTTRVKPTSRHSSRGALTEGVGVDEGEGDGVTLALEPVDKEAVGVGEGELFVIEVDVGEANESGDGEADGDTEIPPGAETLAPVLED